MPLALVPKLPPQQIVEKVEAIATLPEVTTRIVAAVSDVNSDADDLVRIIAHDPALVARVLKMVNSSFYGLPRRVESIDRAIMLLGFNAIEKLALAAGMGQLFKGVKLCEGFGAKDLWTHCIAVGVVAREIARELAPPLAEEAFMAGLIHDLGILVELQVMPESLREVCARAKSEPTPFVELERDMLGTDHQELGALLAARWKFPPACAAVAGAHHPPAQPQHEQALVALVRAADTLCCGQRMGFNLTALRQTMDGPGLESLAITPAMLDRLRTDVGSLVWTAVTILS